MNNNEVLCAIEGAWKEFERTGEIANGADNLLSAVTSMQAELELLRNPWVSVEGNLPVEAGMLENRYIDVWCVDITESYRVAGVEFYDGKFRVAELDYQGDYSHHQEVFNVTHWMPLPSYNGEK